MLEIPRLQEKLKKHDLKGVDFKGLAKVMNQINKEVRKELEENGLLSSDEEDEGPKEQVSKRSSSVPRTRALKPLHGIDAKKPIGLLMSPNPSRTLRLDESYRHALNLQENESNFTGSLTAKRKRLLNESGAIAIMKKAGPFVENKISTFEKTKNFVMYTSQKAFHETSLQQFNTLRVGRKESHMAENLSRGRAPFFNIFHRGSNSVSTNSTAPHITVDQLNQQSNAAIIVSMKIDGSESQI